MTGLVANQRVASTYECKACDLSISPPQVHVGEDLANRCPRCVQIIRNKTPIDPIIATKTREAFLDRPRYLVVLHGLHACGSARIALMSCRRAFEKAIYRVVVIATRGGGNWYQRFQDVSDEIVILPNENERYNEVVDSYFANSIGVEVHYQPAISWILESQPQLTCFSAYFHTENLYPTENRDLVVKLLEKKVLLHFPTASLLKQYASKLTDNELKWFLDCSQITPNRVMPGELEGPVHNSLHEYGTDKLKVAIVTRLDKDKTDREALEAAVNGSKREGLDVVFALAGAGEDRDYYLENIKTAVGDNLLRVLGYVDDVASIYRWADLLFLPSWTEVYPLVTLEAEEHGVPTLLPDIDHLRDAFSESAVEHIWFQRDELSSIVSCLLSSIDKSKRCYLGV